MCPRGLIDFTKGATGGDVDNGEAEHACQQRVFRKSLNLPITVVMNLNLFKNSLLKN